MSVLLFDDSAARGFTRAGDDVKKTSADLRWLRGDRLGRAELRLEHHFSQSVGEHFLLTPGRSERTAGGRVGTWLSHHVDYSSRAYLCRFFSYFFEVVEANARFPNMT